MKKDGKGYLLPSVIDPPGRQYVCVPVPDEQRHRLAFLGQIDMLARWWTWARDDNNTAAAVAQVWQPIADGVRTAMQEGENCGDGCTLKDIYGDDPPPIGTIIDDYILEYGVVPNLIEDIRVVGGQVQKLPVGGEWTNVTNGEFVRRDASLDPDISGATRITGEVQTPSIVYGDTNSTRQWRLGVVSAELRLQHAINFSSAPITIGANPAAQGIRIDDIFRSRIAFAHQRQTSTNAWRDAARLDAGWDEATDASRRGNLALTVHDASASREIIRGGTSGSAPLVGFLGATPIARPILSGNDSGNAALRSLLAALASYGLITDSTTQGSAPTNGQNGASAELRVFEGYIQWRQSDDNPTWTNLVNLASLQGAQGVPGQPGAQGEPGVPGQDGQDCDCTYSQPPQETNTDNLQNLCAGATRLTDWLIAVLRNNIDTLQFYNEIIGNALDDLIEAIPFIGGAISTVVDLAQSLVSLGTTTVEGQIADPAFRETMFCELYCILKEQPTGANKFTEAVFTQWMNTLPLPARLALSQLASDVIGFAECSRRFYVYAQGSSAECGLCTDCAEEEYPNCGDTVTIDITNGVPGYALVPAQHPSFGRGAAGVYSASVGRTAAGSFMSEELSGEHVLQFEVDLGKECDVRYVSLWRRTTAVSGGNNFPLGLNMYDASGSSRFTDNTQRPSTTTWEQWEWGSPTITIATQVRYITVTCVTTVALAPAYLDDITIILA